MGPKFNEETEINSHVSKTILLTGAGFTRDFGGYLADEMWSIIFNHPAIQQREALRKFLLDPRYDFNFELLYHLVLSNRTEISKDDPSYPWSPEFRIRPFSPVDEDREALRTALIAA